MVINYSAHSIGLEGTDMTNEEGWLNLGKFPVNTPFNINSSKDGFDARSDVIIVGDQPVNVSIPMNPQVSKSNVNDIWPR